MATARRELSPAQQRGVDLFAAGMSVTAVAAGLGVSRQTASEWLNQDPIFRASLNARRQEVWSSAADQLRSMLPAALAALAESQGPNKLKAASTILRAVGMAEIGAPSGSTNAAEIEVDDQERDAECARRSGFAALGI
jgi:hypothetical protein